MSDFVASFSNAVLIVSPTATPTADQSNKFSCQPNPCVVGNCTVVDGAPTCGEYAKNVHINNVPEHTILHIIQHYPIIPGASKRRQKGGGPESGCLMWATY